MARTLSEIQASIKANFVANSTLSEAYALDSSKTFDEQFSSVSIEACIILVIAMAHYVIERMMDTFRTEIDTKINNAYIASIPWFYQKALDYQHGYSIELNPKTYQFGYSEINEEAKVVKFAAVRQVEDTIPKLKIYVANALKEPLTSEQFNAFKNYMYRVGPAGIHYEFVNQNADLVRINIQVIFDPLIINDSGQKLTNNTVYPVRDAIQGYIDGITFGGVFNRTKLVDAIQSAEGVKDVILVSLEHAEYGGTFEIVNGQNVESASGSFKIDMLTDDYTPDV